MDTVMNLQSREFRGYHLLVSIFATYLVCLTACNLEYRSRTPGMPPTPPFHCLLHAITASRHPITISTCGFTRSSVPTTSQGSVVTVPPAPVEQHVPGCSRCLQLLSKTLPINMKTLRKIALSPTILDTWPPTRLRACSGDNTSSSRFSYGH